MELLEVCLRTTYFRVDNKFFQQKDNMSVGSSHPLLAASTWSILRNWLLTWHNTNHCCGSGILTTCLSSDFMARSCCGISSVASVV
jgi:hypothetical protein